MDRNNRSVTLLRYVVIFTIHDFKVILNTEEIKKIVHEGIYDYFYPKNEKRKNIRLISIYVHNNYVEINFQALPVFDLKDSVEKLYIHSKKYIMNKEPQLGVGDVLWSENIFLSTRRQFVNQQIKAYLDFQIALSTVEKC